MTDIQFAIEHKGEYFQYEGYTVRVIGFDATDTEESVIIDYPEGWGLELARTSDIIYRDLCETGKCFYVKQEDLKCL